MVSTRVSVCVIAFFFFLVQDLDGGQLSLNTLAHVFSRQQPGTYFIKLFGPAILPQ
jgi:hypothetical protein